jgi:hypothetical protein
MDRIGRNGQDGTERRGLDGESGTERRIREKEIRLDGSVDIGERDRMRWDRYVDIGGTGCYAWKDRRMHVSHGNWPRFDLHLKGQRLVPGCPVFRACFFP